MSRDALAYARDIKAQTGSPLHPSQRRILAQNLRENRYTRLWTEAGEKHRVAFNNVKDDLIAQWEANTGQAWPRYTEQVLSKRGRVLREVGDPYDAHHVIENVYGGPHEWWNIHPARFPDQHQGGLHRALGRGGVVRRIFE